MKKIIFSSLICMGVSFLGYTQDNIVIKVEATGQGMITPTGDDTDYSSGHSPFIYTTSSSTVIDIVLNIENNTGIDKQWRVSRYREPGEPSDWTHTICLGASCFLNSTLNPYCTPANNQQNPDNELSISNGQSGEASAHFTIPTPGSGRYTLFLGDCVDFNDSITIEINYLVGVNELNQTPSFSMYPNPSDDVVTIQLNNTKNGTVKIVDLVGNVVYSETISSSKTLNTSEFKNGIYFVTIESEGSKMTSRKLVVKH